MFNRTVDTPWNTYGRQAWEDGWKQMLIPGTYERGIFGDLMLPGIACGVRKILLIFNTNLNSPHDPIYIVDPLQFNVRPDTEIPIVLAYNMAHYESMHPCTPADIQLTVNLITQYQEGRYQFRRSDLPFLLGQQTDNNTFCQDVIVQKSTNKELVDPSKQKASITKGKQGTHYTPRQKAEQQSASRGKQGINLDQVDEYLDTLGKEHNYIAGERDIMKKSEHIQDNLAPAW